MAGGRAVCTPPRHPASYKTKGELSDVPGGKSEDSGVRGDLPVPGTSLKTQLPNEIKITKVMSKEGIDLIRRR